MSTRPSTTASSRTSVGANLVALTKSLQFSWFLGHVTTLVSTILYLLTYRSGGFFNAFFYKLAYLGVVESFGIILFQSFKARRPSIPVLLQDDNVQYTYDALIWLLAPVNTLSIAPFFIFSVFHVLGYTANLILPALNHPPSSPLITRISAFIKNNNEKSLFYSASLELLLAVVLFFKALFFRKRSWVILAAYTYFVKLRYQKSVYTRASLKAYEVRADGFFSDPRLPPIAKQYWAKFKSILAATLGTHDASTRRPAAAAAKSK